MSKLAKMLEENVPDWSKCQMCRLRPWTEFHRIIGGVNVNVKLCKECYGIISGKEKGEKSYPLRLGDMVQRQGDGWTWVVVSTDPPIASDSVMMNPVDEWEVQRKGKWCPIFQREESDDEGN